MWTLSQRLVHHQCFCQTSNSSNPNPCDHPSPIPSFTPAPLVWTWVSTLDVFRSFHLGIYYPCLYNDIHTILRHDVQMTFGFPLDKLRQNLYNVATWHLTNSLPTIIQWCFVLPLRGRAISNREMRI
jgi:hypothetical protein